MHYASIEFIALSKRRFSRVFAYTSCVEAAKIRHDTRALQHYLGHKNIQHTVRYTDMAPDRLKDFWRG